jgi:tRNA pseudouridine38-40 synthase
MSVRTLQLVLHYDGARFAGWQSQPNQRTVQGEVERVLAQLCGHHVVARGAGRTDAGVHARGQVVGIQVPDKWNANAMRRATNALLPDDLWVAESHEMRPDFHARYSATGRRYSYTVGLSESALSPFRRRWEWFVPPPLDREALGAIARHVIGEHHFYGFAVRGTAPEEDDHRCHISEAHWDFQPERAVFHIAANRFLHHMVRFLVGTMIDVARGRRPASDLTDLLMSTDNLKVSPPAPAHGLVLESVEYPSDLFLSAQ